MLLNMKRKGEKIGSWQQTSQLVAFSSVPLMFPAAEGDKEELCSGQRLSHISRPAAVRDNRSWLAPERACPHFLTEDPGQPVTPTYLQGSPLSGGSLSTETEGQKAGHRERGLSIADDLGMGLGELRC